MSIVDFKKFNVHVVTPHEALLALEPSIFQWESKIITDYNVLLQKMGASQNDLQEDILSHEFTSTDLVVVDQKHRELVPIFSSQVIQRYENFAYKGLEVDLTSNPLNEDGTKKYVPISKGLTGIASKYEGEN